PATSALLSALESVATDGEGNFYIADTVNHRIRKVDPRGVISTLAGNGVSGFSGDGAPATSAQLSAPRSVTIDRAGNLYIADSGNNRVRKITAAGVISTIAGNGNNGFGGDGGPATSAQLSVWGVAADSAGNLYLSDRNNHLIRKVSPGGVISRVAGTGFFGFSGDGGPATAAQLNNPQGMAIDGAGNLFIADGYNHRVRKIGADGIIRTVAGTGSQGDGGDGGPATNSQLRYPQGVAVDSDGALYIADTSNGRLRKVSANGTISTFAGGGGDAFGDGLRQISIWNVATDGAGNVYIADANNNRVRKIVPYTPDTIPPIITITSPTTATLTTFDGRLPLAGGASDNNAGTQGRWGDGRGGRGDRKGIYFREGP